jgi:hypothetical protein
MARHTEQIPEAFPFLLPVQGIVGQFCSERQDIPVFGTFRPGYLLDRP